MTNRLLPFPLALALIATACNQPHTYTIDLSKVRDFDWNGKLIIKDECPSILTGYRVREVELRSNDGRAAAIDTTRIQPVVTLYAPPGQHATVSVTTTIDQPFAFPRKQTELIQYQKRRNLHSPAPQTHQPTTTQEVSIDESPTRGK